MNTARISLPTQTVCFSLLPGWERATTRTPFVVEPFKRRQPFGPCFSMSPRQTLPSLPPEHSAYQEFLDCLTAKDREERFASGAEIIRALRVIGTGRAVRNRAGVSALAAMNRQSGGFDLLLTDVKMPVMDGIALALAAGRDHPDTAIMLMTGYADQRERAHGLDALVHDVIAQPFSLA